MDIVTDIDVKDFEINVDGTLQKNIYYPLFVSTKIMDNTQPEHDNWSTFQDRRKELKRHISM